MNHELNWTVIAKEHVPRERGDEPDENMMEDLE